MVFLDNSFFTFRVTRDAKKQGTNNTIDNSAVKNIRKATSLKLSATLNI